MVYDSIGPWGQGKGGGGAWPWMEEEEVVAATTAMVEEAAGHFYSPLKSNLKKSD